MDCVCVKEPQSICAGCVSKSLNLPQSICAKQVESRAAYVRCGGALSALPSASTNAPAQGEACERWLRESCTRMGSRNSQSPFVAVAVGAASHLVHGAAEEAAHAQRHCTLSICLPVNVSMYKCVEM